MREAFTPVAIKAGAPGAGFSSLSPRPSAGRCAALGAAGRRVFFTFCMKSSVFFLPKTVTPNHP